MNELLTQRIQIITDRINTHNIGGIQPISGMDLWIGHRVFGVKRARKKSDFRIQLRESEGETHFGMKSTFLAKDEILETAGYFLSRESLHCFIGGLIQAADSIFPANRSDVSSISLPLPLTVFEREDGTEFRLALELEDGLIVLKLRWHFSVQAEQSRSDEVGTFRLSAIPILLHSLQQASIVLEARSANI